MYNEHGMAEQNVTGMFPREFMNRFPLLPLEEEGRLNDMPLRENFIERIFACYRWPRMLDEEPTPGGLVKFYSAQPHGPLGSRVGAVPSTVRVHQQVYQYPYPKELILRNHA